MVFPEKRKTGGRLSVRGTKSDMHYEVEMVAGQLVRGIRSSEKRSSLVTEMLQSRMSLVFKA